MRLVRFVIAIVCLVAGAALGALNRDIVAIDLGAVVLSTSLGVALIVALLTGVLLGGLALTASVVLPLRRRLARQLRTDDTVPATKGP